jgi:hypothetical protein
MTQLDDQYAAEPSHKAAMAEGDLTRAVGDLCVLADENPDLLLEHIKEMCEAHTALAELIRMASKAAVARINRVRAA